MGSLQTKIEQTTLFSPEAKVKLLAHLEEIPEAEQAKLMEIIDRFDARYKELAEKLRREVGEEMAGLKAEAAPDEKQAVEEASEILQAGVNVLTGTSS